MEPRTISPSPNVALVTTAPRVTPTPPRAAKFGEVLANTAVRTAESAITSLPGGPMMALAVRGGSASVPLGIGSSSSALTSAGAKSAEGPGVTGSAASSTGLTSGLTGGSSVDGSGGIESSLQQSQEMNLYMLNVQQQVQQQNQHFTTLSNVMKAQHDTVKTAIGNIR